MSFVINYFAHMSWGFCFGSLGTNVKWKGKLQLHFTSTGILTSLSHIFYSPPLISPLVQIADRDSVVITHTMVEMPMMINDSTEMENKNDEFCQQNLLSQAENVNTNTKIHSTLQKFGLVLFSFPERTQS